MNVYPTPHRVPPEWRAWAERGIRSQRWAWKSIAWTLVFQLPLLLVVALHGWVSGLVLVALILGMAVGVAWPTTNVRRRQALAMLREGRGLPDVRMRWWDLPLALGVGGAMVAAFLLSGP